MRKESLVVIKLMPCYLAGCVMHVTPLSVIYTLYNRCSLPVIPTRTLQHTEKTVPHVRKSASVLFIQRIPFPFLSDLVKVLLDLNSPSLFSPLHIMITVGSLVSPDLLEGVLQTGPADSALLILCFPFFFRLSLLG